MDRKSKYFFKKCVSFSEVALTENQNTSIVQILRTGSWDHPVYGQFKVDLIDLAQFVQNFQNNIRGVDLCVDVNHESGHRAVGWYREVYQEGDALFASIEWTTEGIQYITSKQYRYFSPELYFSFRDEESGEVTNNVLVGGGITNRPFFKGMKALQMSEPENPIENEARKTFYFYNSDSMTKSFSDIVAELASVSKVSPAQLDEARLAFSELPSAEHDTAVAQMSAIEAKFSEDEGTPSDEAPVDTPVDTQAVETQETPAEEAPADEPNPAHSTLTPIDAPVIEASETDKESAVFKETGMTTEQIKNMQKSFSEMAQKQKLADLDKLVTACTFSQTNPVGTVLPKAKNAIVTFASKLPEGLVKEFMELIKAPNFAGTPVSFQEKGSNASEQFTAPKEIPSGVDRESYILANLATQFKEKDASLTLESATLKAHEYMTQNGIK